MSAIVLSGFSLTEGAHVRGFADAGTRQGAGNGAAGILHEQSPADLKPVKGSKDMSLKEYFETTEGTGILATANPDGKVDAAVYARPHFPEGNDRTLAFIMSSRLSYRYLQANPNAVYVFMEKGEGYRGKRLYLFKTGEDASAETIEKMRRKPCGHFEGVSDKQVVYFRVENERPLVGDG